MTHSSTLHVGRTALCIALLAALSACGKKPEPLADAAPHAERFAAAPAPAIAPPPSQVQAAGALLSKTSAAPMEERAASSPNAATAGQMTSSASAYADGERQFIRTANANFRVKDVYQSALAIEDAVGAHGGFVVKNNIAASVQNTQRRATGDGKLTELAEYTVAGQLTVRVPSAKTQEFLRAIVGQIVFLDQRGFSANDAQFDLLRQQLEYKRNQETQDELGAASKGGGKLDQKADVIGARNATKAARDNALVAKKQFEDQVAFSTIDLSIYQLPAVRQTEITDVDAVFRQNRPGFGARLVDSLRDGWERLLDCSLWLAQMWPLWTTICAAAWIVLRRRKNSGLAAAEKS